MIYEAFTFRADDLTIQNLMGWGFFAATGNGHSKEVFAGKHGHYSAIQIKWNEFVRNGRHGYIIVQSYRVLIFKV